MIIGEPVLRRIAHLLSCIFDLGPAPIVVRPTVENVKKQRLVGANTALYQLHNMARADKNIVFVEIFFGRQRRIRHCCLYAPIAPVTSTFMRYVI